MPSKAQFRIETATPDNWPWIVQCHGEVAWVRLGREGQREANRQAIQERVAQQAGRIRWDKGFPTQTFVAKAEDGTLVGYVWVAKSHHDFTGEQEASLLSQYVAEPYRGQGLGRR